MEVRGGRSHRGGVHWRGEDLLYSYCGNFSSSMMIRDEVDMGSGSDRCDFVFYDYFYLCFDDFGFCGDFDYRSRNFCFESHVFSYCGVFSYCAPIFPYLCCICI